MTTSGDLSKTPACVERPWCYILFSGYDPEKDSTLYEFPDDESVVVDEIEIQMFDRQCEFLEWQQIGGRGFHAASSWWTEYADAVEHTNTFAGKPLWWHIVSLDTLQIVARSDDSKTHH